MPFQNLKITNIKALKEATLRDLGKINVVCGKNNSGKSTLLEGIIGKEHRDIGKSFEESDFDKLRVYFIETDWWNSLSNADREIFLSVVHEVIKTQKAWFLEDRYKFAKMVRNKVFETTFSYRPNGSLLSEEMLAFAFSTLYEDNYSIILLPPKRNLESDVSLGKQHIRPDGWGLISTLFYAKNQTINSQERIFYERISEAFTNISSGYNFDISIANIESATKLSLKFAYNDKQWVDANDCGLGLQDLIVILFFALDKDHEIVLIEEPESHLHPDIQRRLLRFLREETDKQFFITTHGFVA